MKKLTALVIGLVAGLSLSSGAVGQTVTTYVFESNVQEELNYDKASDSFVATNNYYDDHYFGEAIDPGFCEVIGTIHDRKEAANATR